MEKLDFALEIRSADVKDDGTFSGYASTFGGEPDSYGDIIMSGAFKKSISAGGRNKNGVAMLWQHYNHQVPGVWKQLIEDSRGLAVVGKLALDVQIGKEAYSLMKIDAIKGLSIGFNAVEFDYDQKTKVRTLKEVDLWEISLVTFPANVHAQITGVKAFEEATTIREFEQALRDAGLSYRQSKYIISLCQDSFERERAYRDGGDGVALREAVRSALQNVKIQ